MSAETMGPPPSPDMGKEKEKTEPSTAELIASINSDMSPKQVGEVMKSLTGRPVDMRYPNGNTDNNWTVMGVTYEAGKDEQDPGGWKLLVKGNNPITDQKGNIFYPSGTIRPEELAGMQPEETESPEKESEDSHTRRLLESLTGDLKPEDAKLITTTLDGREVTVPYKNNKGKITTVEDGWKVQGFRYQQSRDTTPAHWLVTVRSGTPKMTDQGERYSVRTLRASELALYQGEVQENTPDEAEPKDAVEKELLEAQSTDRELLRKSEALRVNILDVGRKLVNRADTIQNHLSPGLAHRLNAYNRAKESHAKKQQRAERAKNRLSRAIFEKRARKAEEKLAFRRANLRESIYAKKVRNAQLRERVAGRENHVNNTIRGFVDLGAEAATRKAAHAQLRAEHIRRGERKQAIEQLLQNPQMRETIHRAGRVLIEHAKTEQESRAINKKQRGFEKRSKKLEIDQQQLGNRLKSLQKAAVETEDDISKLRDTDIPDAKKEIGRWMELHRKATINDDIETINKNLAHAHEQVRQLEENLKLREEHRKRLDNLMSGVEEKQREVAGKLQGNREASISHALDIAEPSKAHLHESHERRSKAVDELVGTFTNDTNEGGAT